MRYLITRPLPLSALSFIFLCLLSPTLVIAASNGNGNNNGNGQDQSNGNGAANLSVIVSELEAEIDSLQSDVAILTDSIANLGVASVIADCNVDPAALQSAIDAAPAAGAIINIEGNCDSAAIIGKANLLIDGGNIGNGSGLSGPLNIDASRNIQLSELTAEGLNNTITIANNSSVFLNGDIAIQTDVKVEVNSSLVQLAGFATIGGSVNGHQSANVTLNNSSLGGFSLSRSSSLILRTTEPSNSITVNGSMGVFSGSHFLAQAAASVGSVTLTTVDTIIVQRTAAMLLAGDGLQINAADFLVRQNAVLDVISVLDSNFNIGSITLTQGGGARLYIPDSVEGYVAYCDDTSWTNGALVCAE